MTSPGSFDDTSSHGININSGSAVPFPTSLLEPIASALGSAYQDLSRFSMLPNAFNDIERVYDNAVSGAVYSRLSNWRNGIFTDIAEIIILDDLEMNGAQGAYSAERNEIYIAKSLLEKDSLTGLKKVLLEEYGHQLDVELNLVGDTPGDEGELFSLVVLGSQITELDLIRLRTENDTSFVFLNGQEVVVEQSAATLDFNGDSRPDLLWRDRASGQNAVWFMGGTNNTQITGSASLTTVGGSWDVKGIADFNGDGGCIPVLQDWDAP